MGPFSLLFGGFFIIVGLIVLGIGIHKKTDVPNYGGIGFTNASFTYVGLCESPNYVCTVTYKYNDTKVRIFAGVNNDNIHTMTATKFITVINDTFLATFVKFDCSGFDTSCDASFLFDHNNATYTKHITMQLKDLSSIQLTREIEYNSVNPIDDLPTTEELTSQGRGMTIAGGVIMLIGLIILLLPA
jgi:hypothetical protein